MKIKKTKSLLYIFSSVKHFFWCYITATSSLPLNTTPLTKTFICSTLNSVILSIERLMFSWTRNATSLTLYPKNTFKNTSQLTLFSSKTISASIRIHKELATQFIEEWFGKNVRFYYKNNELFADIKANETSLIYWCLQYGDHIELISPKETRNKIKEKIKQMQMRYMDDGK